MHPKRLPLLATILLLAAAAPAPAPITLAPQPGTVLDQAARALARDDLAQARRAGEEPLVLVGSAKLSPTDRPALFVQLQSPRECGSSGCGTTVYLWRAGTWSRVLDGVGGKLAVAPTRTRGMADLVGEKTRYLWDGKTYRDARPAPAVDLKPRI